VITVANFDALYAEWHPRLCGFIARMLGGDRVTAEDLAQDTWVKVLGCLADGATVAPASMRHWLFRIAHNTTVDHLRRRRLVAFNQLSAAIVEAVPNECAADRFEDRIGDREAIGATLAQLRAAEVAPLLLSRAAGLSHQEIAVRLMLGDSQAKMRILRAAARFTALYRAQEAC
jgi:RNA polymerase sigma-70 factor (ECF subfamily)